MKFLFSTLFIFFTLIAVTAQNFKNVDSIVRLYPNKYGNADQLSEQIAKDFTTDIDKVRAIYTWLALNVSYDLETFYSGNTAINFSYTDQADLQRKQTAITTNTVNSTLRTKKAICEGYAQTFKQVSEKLSIPCMLVGGFSKGDVSNIGVIPKNEDHAWNAVKINKQWYLIDATWGAGYTNGAKWVQRFNDFFFFTKPEEFAKTHFPSEPTWLMTRKKISKQDFYTSPIYEMAFFKNKLTLLSPLKGEIHAKLGENIKFTMGKIPENLSLYYAFKGDKFSEKIVPNCVDDICTFTIPFTNTTNSELIIFVNKQTALQYRVILRE